MNILTGYDTSVPHRHNYYEMFVFIKGGGWHDIDFSKIEIASKSIHFVSPGQVHMLRREPDSYGFVILFPPEFLHISTTLNPIAEFPFLLRYGSSREIRFDEEGFEEIEAIAKRILSSFEMKKPEMKEIIRSYLNVILLQCKIRFEETANMQKPAEEHQPGRLAVQQFQSMLESDFKTLQLVKDYAAQLAITPEHLNDLTKQHLGKNASELIAERITLEIKRMLLFSDFSIKEIAFSLNFSDPSNFNKYFKNQMGCTPAQYRKELQKKYFRQ